MPILIILAAGGAIGLAIGLPVFASKFGGTSGASTGAGAGDALRIAALGSVVVVGYGFIKGSI